MNMLKKILLTQIFLFLLLTLSLIAYNGISAFEIASTNNKVRVEQILKVQADMVNELERLVQKGELPESQAKNIALNILRNINYSNKEYVWVASKQAIQTPI